MIPERVIEKAFEGGLKLKGGWRRPYGALAPNYLAQCGIAFDPAFWKALGRALDWPSDDGPIPAEMTLEQWRRQRPIGRALRFYQIVYAGGDAGSYWNDLIP